MQSRKILEAIVEAGAEQMSGEIGLVGEDVGGERGAEGREIGTGGLDSRTKIVPEIFPLHRPMFPAAQLEFNTAAGGPASQCS